MRTHASRTSHLSAPRTHRTRPAPHHALWFHNDIIRVLIAPLCVEYAALTPRPAAMHTNQRHEVCIRPISRTRADRWGRVSPNQRLFSPSAAAHLPLWALFDSGYLHISVSVEEKCRCTIRCLMIGISQSSHRLNCDGWVIIMVPK